MQRILQVTRRFDIGCVAHIGWKHRSSPSPHSDRLHLLVEKGTVVDPVHVSRARIRARQVSPAQTGLTQVTKPLAFLEEKLEVTQ